MYWRVVLFILCIGLSGCDLDQWSPQASLQVGSNRWPGYEPLYLAKSRGYLEPAGIRMVLLPSSSEVMRAFRNGVLDVAAVTLDEALQLAASGTRLKIFLVTDISDGADVILAHPFISNLSELEGKRIGVESTAMGAFVLSRALQVAGLRVDQVELVDLQADQHESAFLRAQVDAVVTFEPMRTRLLQQGAVSLFDSSQIPDEIVDVLVVKEAVVESHSDQLRQLVDAWYKALDFLQQQPAEADRLAGKHQGVSGSDFRQALQGLEIPSRQRVKQLLSAEGIGQRAMPMQKWMLQQQLLPRDTPVEHLLLPDFL